ncbi:MAG: hypothetical protein ABGX16_22555 [Pirellulales bacterium]
MTDYDPIAIFITWTVYGTHLQGDVRGWKRRRQGPQTPQPLLAHWRSERLKHPVLLLDSSKRTVVENEIERHGQHRGWHLWAISDQK